MNLKKEYTKLYQHWFAELDQTELTPLFQKDFNAYKDSVNKITTVEIQEDDSVKQGFINHTCCQYVGKIILSLQPYCMWIINIFEK